MKKLFNAIASLLLIGGWLVMMLLVWFFDVLQLDGLGGYEITFTYYIVFTAIYFGVYWVLSRFGLMNGGVDGDIDFD